VPTARRFRGYESTPLVRRPFGATTNSPAPRSARWHRRGRPPSFAAPWNHARRAELPPRV